MEKQLIKVSIITPTYNASHWLPGLFASVKSQTFQNWEHILCDDGSTDQTVEIIEATAKNDSRIRMLRMPAHTGRPAPVRNAAIQVAQGRYLAFLDADDLWLPQKLAAGIQFMQTNGYAFIYHDFRYMNHAGNKVGNLVHGPEILDKRSIFIHRGTGDCMSVMIDREQIPYFQFEQKGQHEDLLTWISLVRTGWLGHRLPLDLGRYRLALNSRNSNKLCAALEVWKTYRSVQDISYSKSALYWLLYAWYSFWLHLRSRPSLIEQTETAKAV
jgi:glycosyltransferase involved in cell wall biosynthesis